MVKPLLQCPNCSSNDINKNGTTHHGNQNYKCRDCGRQFVENPKWKRLGDDTKATIERMLLEKIPLAGIALETSRVHWDCEHCGWSDESV